MKKLSILEGVHTAGLVLVVTAVVGAISIGGNQTTNNNEDVLSITETNVMTMIVSYGAKTLTEIAPLESGFPDIVKGGGAAVKVMLDPIPSPGSTTVTFTTNDSCVLFNDGIGGGLFGQSKTDTINSLYTIAIGAVDDDLYEGEHYCKLVATLTSSDETYNNQQQKLTFTITDNDPKPENYDDKKSTESSDNTTNKTATESNSKLQPPTAKFLDKSGSEIEINEQSKPSFEEQEPIYLKGTTVANGEVKLYIYSELQTATVTASDEGEWSYTIESIEPGEHRVEIEVTDPATGATSERSEVLAFQVGQTELLAEPIASENASTNDEGSSSSSIGLYIVTGISLGLLLVGITGGIIWKKRHPHQNEVISFNSDENNNF